MIKSISAITLATHNHMPFASIARWDLRSFMAARTQRLRAFGLEQVISILSPNLSSGIGPVGTCYLLPLGR
jgi:hypothetical protein